MYTEKLHAKRLLGMLNKPDPCLCCPKTRFYEIGSNHISAVDDSMDACRVCEEFVGILPVAGLNSCPCYTLGEQRAIRLTWIALEEKGYLD